ncbi:hypothetical protein BH11ACT6_BH11ACT6_25150 [soil metagenome]
MALNRPARRISVAIGGGAIIAMIGFTAACSSESSEPQESTTTTTTTTTTPPALTPTEKKVSPDATDGLTPPVKAPQPTVQHPRSGAN